MPQEGQKTITMSGQRLKKLELQFIQEKKRQPSLSFSAFIADSALIELERRDLLNKAAMISLVALQDDTIILKDFKNKEKFVEVQIKDKKLRCNNCEKDCIHIGFALALPEIRKILAS